VADAGASVAARGIGVGVGGVGSRGAVVALGGLGF
jgi:hypothetical protein